MSTACNGAGAHDAAPPPLRLTGPADLIELVPYLVGFHPADSVVAVAFEPPGQQVSLVLRADRADLRSSEPLRRQLVAHLRRSGARDVVFVVVAAGDDPDPVVGSPLPDADLVSRLGEAAGAEGLPVADALHLGGGRWWSYQCRDDGCCPAEGRPVAGRGSRVAAEATYAGLVALPDRSSLAATLDPEPGAGAALDGALRRMEETDPGAVGATAAATSGGVADDVEERRQRWREELRSRQARLLDRVERDGTAPWLSEEELAALVVGLRETGLRDDAWLWMERQPSQYPRALELWRQVARRAPERYRTPPLFLAAWAAWRSGSGALARLAIERALALEPGYGAARLLERAIVQGLDPRMAPLATGSGRGPVCEAPSRPRSGGGRASVALPPTGTRSGDAEPRRTGPDGAGPDGTGPDRTRRGGR